MTALSLCLFLKQPRMTITHSDTQRCMALCTSISRAACKIIMGKKVLRHYYKVTLFWHSCQLTSHKQRVSQKYKKQLLSNVQRAKGGVRVKNYCGQGNVRFLGHTNLISCFWSCAGQFSLSYLTYTIRCNQM